jgi:anaerobic selenocysteine-containing dehydrogenase
MEVNRRDFLKLSGASVGATTIALYLGNGTAMAVAREIPLKRKVKETSTICCYCGVGCGAIVSTYEDGIIKIEGNPDHPINQGSLCPKGLAMSQIHQVDGELNPYRLTKPLYRAPGATDWEEKSWGWMIGTIAAKVKETRDAPGAFTTIDNNGKTVNRNEKIASLGGGELDNEECYLLSKMNRALGVVYLEHCARI